MKEFPNLLMRSDFLERTFPFLCEGYLFLLRLHSGNFLAAHPGSGHLASLESLKVESNQNVLFRKLLNPFNWENPEEQSPCGG